jgi:thymidylate synthase (FAD)
MKIIKQHWRFENKPDYNTVLEIIEKAARTCYKSEDKIAEGSAEKLISALIKNGHHSVLEHISISVRIVTDRAVTHELVRHRIGVAYSQESQRYVAYKDDVEFILPCWCSSQILGQHNIIREGVILRRQQGQINPELSPRENVLFWSFAQSEKNYQDLLEVGCKPEEARSVLPNSTKTEIFVTANLRQWRHIFNLRCSKKAHPQIRALMTDIRNTFAQEYPIFFKDLLTTK